MTSAAQTKNHFIGTGVRPIGDHPGGNHVDYRPSDTEPKRRPVLQSVIRADAGIRARKRLGSYFIVVKLLAIIQRVRWLSTPANVDSGVVHLRLVNAFPRLYVCPDKSYGSRLWRAVGVGNLDFHSHQNNPVISRAMFAPIATSQLAIVSAAIASFLVVLSEAVTSFGGVAVTLASSVGAAIITFLCVIAKIRYDKWKTQQAISQRVFSTDAQTSLERERLLDEQVNSFIAHIQAFHSEQVKGLQSQIALKTELSEQQVSVIQQQRELITQQAREIQRLQQKN